MSEAKETQRNFPTARLSIRLKLASATFETIVASAELIPELAERTPNIEIEFGPYIVTSLKELHTIIKHVVQGRKALNEAPAESPAQPASQDTP